MKKFKVKEGVVEYSGESIRTTTSCNFCPRKSVGMFRTFRLCQRHVDNLKQIAQDAGVTFVFHRKTGT